MNNTFISVGRILFAISLAVFGLEYFLYAHTSTRNVPPWILASPMGAYLAGIVLVAISASFLTKVKARAAAMLLAVAFVVLFLVAHLPPVFAHFWDGTIRSRAMETLAMGAGALVLAGALRVPHSSQDTRTAGILAKVGLPLFGFCMVIFGVQHFMYHAFIAFLIPAWMHARLFLAYFTEWLSSPPDSAF